MAIEHHPGCSVYQPWLGIGPPPCNCGVAVTSKTITITRLPSIESTDLESGLSKQVAKQADEILKLKKQVFDLECAREGELTKPLELEE